MACEQTHPSKCLQMIHSQSSSRVGISHQPEAPCLKHQGHKFQETKSTQNGISVLRWGAVKVKWSLEGRRMVSLASGNPTNKSAIHRTLRSSLQLASLANLNSGTTQWSSLEAYTRPQKSNARLPNYVNRVNACSRVCLWHRRVHSSSSSRVHLGNTIKLPPSFTRRNKRVTMKIRQRQEA